MKRMNIMAILIALVGLFVTSCHKQVLNPAKVDPWASVEPVVVDSLSVTIDYDFLDGGPNLYSKELATGIKGDAFAMGAAEDAFASDTATGQRQVSFKVLEFPKAVETSNPNDSSMLWISYAGLKNTGLKELRGYLLSAQALPGENVYSLGVTETDPADSHNGGYPYFDSQQKEILASIAGVSVATSNFILVKEK